MCRSPSDRPRAVRTRELLAALLLAAAMRPGDSAAADAPSGTGAAIARHAVTARLDPSRARLEASDRMLLRLPEGAARRVPVALLLHRDLEIAAVEIAAPGARWEVYPSVEPAAFLAAPDSTDLAALGRCQELDLFPPEGAPWPADTLEVLVRYAGTVYDSLAAPETPYSRGFPVSDGLIDTAGAYLAGSSSWIPSRYADLFTFTLDVELPRGWRSMSQGDLALSEPGPEGLRERWSCADPMQEIYLVAGPYVVERRAWENVELLTYLYHPEPELSARYLDAAARYLERYTRMLGPYPFGKFALVENFWQTGYGMPSFTLLGDRVIRLPFIVDTSYGHEILHNWWGNGVYVRSGDGNWCEGLTTYGADYLYKEEKSPADAREYRRGILRDYLNYVREGKDFPLTGFTERSNPATQSVGYGKTAMVFHMLRRELGDETFWRSLRRFYRDHRFRPAGWREVIAAFEAESGTSLAPFMRQWVESPGAPRIELDRVAAGAAAGAQELRFTLRQGEPPFALAVPVRVRGAERESTFVVELDGPERAVTLRLPWTPREIAADPDFEIFRVVSRGEIPVTLSQTLGADSSAIVIAGGLPEPVRAAYAELAASWTAPEKNVLRLDEGEAAPDRLRGRAVWWFGRSAAAAGLPARLPPAAAAEPWTALVVTAADPGNPELSWSLFDCGDPAAIADIGRRIPHYGGYSYLLFEGTRNTGKGVVEPGESPLRVRLGGARDGGN